jgi:hypothetical protein
MKAESSEGLEPMQEETNSGGGSVPNTEGSDEVSDAGKPETPEDDVPWGNLASFALYKLFTEWQSQGTHVPIPKQTNVSPSKQVSSMQLVSVGIHTLLLFASSLLAVSSLHLLMPHHSQVSE